MYTDNMERVEAVNWERIVWCCADYGISPDALAADLSIPPANFQKVAEGAAALTFNQLRRVAEYFGRGVLFFLDPAPVNPGRVHTPAFRSLANQKPELSAKLRTFIERVERQRAVYLDLREELQGEPVPEFDPPTLVGKSADEAALAVRSWLALGFRNDFASYRAAIEAKGILVFRSNGYNGKWQIPKENPILGFSLYDKSCPVIVVKTERSLARQAFTLMHELAHILLHKASSIDDEADLYSTEGAEREANAFAGRVLVPDAFLAQIQDSDRPHDASEFDDWLESESYAWGISVEVILRRLLDAGRLDHGAYGAYRTWRSKQEFRESDGGNRMWRHREPKHIFGDGFVRTVLDSLTAGYITLTKASSYLDGLKVSDLHLLERHCADT